MNDPLEISDYKRKWMITGAYPVRLHTDLRDHGKDWCKTKLEKEEWDHKKFTGPYEDTYFFEDPIIAQQFEEEFVSWVIKDKE